MTSLVVVGLLAQCVVVALSWLLARRRPEHRPFTVFASSLLAADVARWIVIYACPWIAGTGPHTGARRVVFHADQALFLSWHVGLAAVSWRVFLRRRPTAPIAVGAVLLLALIVGYPWPFRGSLLGITYSVACGASLVASVFAVLIWRRMRAMPRPQHAAVLLFSMLDIAYLAGPYAPPLPEPWADWTATDLVFTGCWIGLLAVHAGALWAGFLTMPEPRVPGTRPQ